MPQTSLHLGAQGRLVIPAALRKQLGLKPDDDLAAYVEDGRLVIERKSDILKRVQAKFAELAPDVSLVDELRKERQWEFEREQQWMETP